jgi:hypothetical protein
MLLFSSQCAASPDFIYFSLVAFLFLKLSSPTQLASKQTSNIKLMHRQLCKRMPSAVARWKLACIPVSVTPNLAIGPRSDLGQLLH